MVREVRTIEVMLISATDLKKVKRFGREQENYVSAYIYPARKQLTGADLHGGVNPTWNSTVKLICYESDIYPAPTNSESSPASSSSGSSARAMTLEIYSHGGGIIHTPDKLVGTVTVPLQQVASAAQAGGGMPAFFVHLPTGSGDVQGSLNLSVKLGAKRELGDYEDLAAAPLSSHSDQGATSSIYPKASGEVPSTQTTGNKSPGQSSTPNQNAIAAAEKPNQNTFAAAEKPNQNTFATAEKAGVATGYPAQGVYVFDPLGQFPVQSGGELGPENRAPGPYCVHSACAGCNHGTLVDPRMMRKQCKRERRCRKRERRCARRAGKCGLQTKARRVGMIALRILTSGLLSAN